MTIWVDFYVIKYLAIYNIEHLLSSKKWLPNHAQHFAKLLNWPSIKLPKKFKILPNSKLPKPFNILPKCHWKIMPNLVTLHGCAIVCTFPVPVCINLAKVNIIKTYICIISISNFNVSCRLRHVNSNTFSRIGDRWSGCKLPSAGLDQYGGILDLPPSAWEQRHCGRQRHLLHLGVWRSKSWTLLRRRRMGRPK